MTDEPDDEEDLDRVLRGLTVELNKREAREAQAVPGIDANGNMVDRNRGLLAFIRYFWHVLEPEATLVEGWAMDAICQHLEAVTLGKLTRLLINVPPGFMKTLITQVWWPAWEWGPMNMPHLRYVSFSYSAGITMNNNVKFRTLVTSKEYRDLWGDRFEVEKEGEVRITNNKQGSKFASSVEGIGTGERGDRIILDDPHSVKQAESDTVRMATVQWFRETMSNRLNHPERSTISIIMQRVHQGDISGEILEKGFKYDHVMIPMRFEPGRDAEIVNSLGWRDPRTEEGELAWPERFSERAVDDMEDTLGSWATAAQHQQRPSPRGGGIIEYSYWRPYDQDTSVQWFGTQYPKLPDMDFTVLAVDTAQTEKKQNDPSAGVVIGVCRDALYGRNQVFLMHAWAERLEFFELCNKVEETCRKMRVHKVLIEDKASGLPLADELRRRTRMISAHIAHGKQEHREKANFSVQTVTPEGDKVARAYAVQGLFEAGVVWAPSDGHGDEIRYKTWAARVMDELAELPKGRHDDLADAMVYGLKFLREIGIALMPDDTQYDEEDRLQHKRQPAAMYPGFV
jgi:predicted phage terminase large subunit-like protein